MKGSCVRRTRSLCWWHGIRNACWRSSANGSLRRGLRSGWTKRRGNGLDYVAGICRGHLDHAVICAAGAQGVADEAVRRLVAGHAGGVWVGSVFVAGVWRGAKVVADYCRQCGDAGADCGVVGVEGKIWEQCMSCWNSGAKAHRIFGKPYRRPEGLLHQLGVEGLAWRAILDRGSSWIRVPFDRVAAITLKLQGLPRMSVPACVSKAR